MFDNQTRNEISLLLKYLLSFIVSPIEALKQLPRTEWKSLIIFQITGAVAVCLFSFLFNRNILHTVLNLAIVPTVLIFCSYLVAFTIVGYFKVFEKREIPFLGIYTLVVISLIPYLIAFPFFPLFPPLSIVACVFSAIAMSVGLVENFRVDKQSALKLMGALVLVFVFIWIVNMIASD